MSTPCIHSPYNTPYPHMSIEEGSAATTSQGEALSEEHTLSTGELLSQFETIQEEVDVWSQAHNLLENDLFEEEFWVEWNRLLDEEENLRTQPPRGVDTSSYDGFLDIATHHLLRFCVHKKLQKCLLNHGKYTIDRIKEWTREDFPLSEQDELAFKQQVEKFYSTPLEFTQESLRVISYFYTIYNTVFKWRADREQQVLQQRNRAFAPPLPPMPSPRVYYARPALPPPMHPPCYLPVMYHPAPPPYPVYGPPVAPPMYLGHPPVFYTSN